MPTLILIGAPGSGKSSIGALLAKKLRQEFIDTDKVIEKREGIAVSKIFVDHGEEYFRDLEFDALKDSLEVDQCVLSLGGGAPISIRAQELLANINCPIIFLDVSLSTAAPRIGFNRDRPLLLGNPRAQWQALLNIRRPIYEKLATVSVKVGSMREREVAAKIMEAIS